VSEHERGLVSQVDREALRACARAAQRDLLETDAFRFVGLFAVSESLVAPLDCVPYVRNSGFTAAQVSRVLKIKRC
jgi:hypothetical protein